MSTAKSEVLGREDGSVRSWDAGRLRISHSIAAARLGEQSALGQLLDSYRAYLLRMAEDELSSRLVPKAGASDVVQESLLQASRDFVRFVGRTDGELRAWLRGILLNTVRDARRTFVGSQKRNIACERPLAEGDSEAHEQLRVADPSPSQVLVARENRARVRAAILLLAPDARRAIELRTFEGRPFKEVGQALGRTDTAARKLWSRAIQELALLFAEETR